MKHILEILKSILATITKLWKVLVGTLFATLFAIVLAFLLRKFPGVRVPTGLAATSIFLVLLLWLFPNWQVRSVPGLEAKDRFDRENEARKTLSQIIGGLVLLIGFYFTWQNLKLTRDSQAEAQKGTQENLRIVEEGQITDRFTKAIAQLGDTKLEIRLGGIYALERIARDSSKDHWPIMEVLTAYVREHANIRPAIKPQLKPMDRWPVPAPDVQAILTVLGRRTQTFQKGEEQPLDLHATYLRGANLMGADLSGAELFFAELFEANLRKALLRKASLRYADLERVTLDDANLDAADLIYADFSGADLNRASLTGADLLGADLSSTSLKHADFTGANIEAADFRGAELSGADLSQAIGSWPRQFESSYGDSTTKLPAGIPRPKSWQ